MSRPSARDRAIRDVERRQNAAARARLTAELKRARAVRRERLRRLRGTMLELRRGLVASQHATRARVLARLRARFDRERAELLSDYREARAEAAAQLTRDVDRARHALATEHGLQRLVRARLRAERHQTRPAAVARVAREESDDAVRHNLPPELVPVFDAVARQIKAGPRSSRTERFLEWAEENADEVVRMQADAGELAALDLIRAHQADELRAERARARPRRRRSPTYAEVPF